MMRMFTQEKEGLGNRMTGRKPHGLAGRFRIVHLASMEAVDVGVFGVMSLSPR